MFRQREPTCPGEPSDVTALAHTCRPHGPAGYERYARDEKHRFGPGQHPIATHVAPQLLDWFAK